MKPSITIWWLHPAVLFGSLGALLVAAAMLIPDTAYMRLWLTPKFLNSENTLLLIAFIVVFVTGALLTGSRTRRDAAPQPDLAAGTLLTLYRVAIGLALFGYLVWGAIAVSRGLNLAVLMDVFGAKRDVLYNIRETYLASIPGITTCTQFGVAAGVLGALIAARSGWGKIRKSLTLLFVLVMLRVTLNTERLALIEIAVPMLVIVLTRVLGPVAQQRPVLRRTISAAPVAGIPILFVLFSAFEYLRSWVYYSNGPLRFWEFAAARLTGYYVTAVNNGAYLVDRLDAPLTVPFFTLNFLWRLPIVSGLVESLFPAFQLTTTYFDVLASGANAELNNSGGLFSPALDFGPAGAILYWLLLGLFCGRMYDSFRRGSAWGLCLYPILFLGLLDVARGLYWSSSRAVPAIAFLVLSAYLLRIPQRREAVRILS